MAINSAEFLVVMADRLALVSMCLGVYLKITGEYKALPCDETGVRANLLRKYGSDPGCAKN